MKQQYLLLGEIVRPQGIRGEVKVKHYTDDPERFYDLETVFLTATDDKMYLSSSLVKQVAQYGEDVSAFVPACIMQDIQEKFRKDG